MTNLDYPESLQYSRDHEWVAGTGSDAAVRVGITDFAQDQLGDVVYVDLPAVGDSITAGEACGEVESTKSVSDIVAPVSGTITAINDSLEDSPETVNSSPFEDGWMFVVELEDTAQLEALLSKEQYLEFIDSEEA